MPCQSLTSNLAASPRPSGSVLANDRPSGMLVANDRPEGNGLCRAFDFTAAVAVGIVTFAGDQMVTFAGDDLSTF